MVDHKIMLQCMRSKFGIKEKALAWLNGAKFDVYNTSCEVLQDCAWSYPVPPVHVSLDNFFRTLNISFHLYAVDSQLYTTFTCRSTQHYTTLNKLKLNRETEFVIFHPTHRQQIIQPSNSIKKLGCCL